VAAALAPSALARPSATGTSMPMAPTRSWLQAARQNGAAQNSATGTLRISWPMRSICAMSGAMAPSVAR